MAVAMGWNTNIVTEKLQTKTHLRYAHVCMSTKEITECYRN